MNRHNEIVSFSKRFSADNWTSGNCYYYAVILRDKFGGEIFYDTIQGHFVVQIDEVFYDYNGVYVPTNKTAVVSWSSFESYDRLQYERIKRDCL